MSKWKELCAEEKKAWDKGYDFKVDREEFDKIRAVVEAVIDFNIKYRYSGKLVWMPALNKMDDALKALGVGDDPVARLYT